MKGWMTKIINKVSYYSQWESPKLVDEIVTRKILARDDPKWSNSGAKSSEEYEYWSWNICGMACLKMILARKTGKEHKTIELAKKCEAYGGYRQQAAEVEGLFYRQFCQFLKQEFNLKGRIFRYFLTIGRIKKELKKGNCFMVSVSSSIRKLNHTPEHKGGHLVLMTGYDDDKKTLYLHNPSGFFDESQENFEVSEKDLRKFFAGRGILIY